jgi:hypothetical protein
MSRHSQKAISYLCTRQDRQSEHLTRDLSELTLELTVPYVLSAYGQAFSLSLIFLIKRRTAIGKEWV